METGAAAAAAAAAAASQAKGDGYSYLEYRVATELMTLLIRKKEEGNGRSTDEQINKHQIRKPRSALLQKPQRVENPPPLKEEEDEFKNFGKDVLMGCLGKKLRKMEEVEKRRRREKVRNGAKTTPFRVLCDDQKQEKTEMPPEMPLKIQETITLLGGTSPVWLTKKTLTQSDVNKDLGRLFIPPCNALKQFLTIEEQNTARIQKKTASDSKKKKQVKKKELGKEEKKKKEIGLNVILVNPMGDQEEVSFRIWESLNKYVFTKTWKSIIEMLDLKCNRDTVQLWCFRLPVERDSKLCFAMNIIKNVQLGDEELDAGQSKKRVNSDEDESRPSKKHRRIKLNSDEDESSVTVEALPQEEYRAVSAKAEE